MPANDTPDHHGPGKSSSWTPPDRARISVDDARDAKKLGAQTWMALVGGSDWAAYLRSFTLEWAFACSLSVAMGALLLGFGACLAWPLRALSDGVLSSSFAELGGVVGAAVPENETRVGGAGGPGEWLMLQGVWDWASKDFGRITTSPAFPGALSICYFFASCLPYTALDMLPGSTPVIGRLKSYKVQQDKPVEWSQVWKTVGCTLYMTFGLQIPGLCHQLVTQGPWPYYIGPQVCLTDCSHMTLPEKAPSVAEVVLHLFMCLWLMDLLYFLYHRHHHQRTWRYGLLLYKHVHGIHHEWRAPFAWCTQYLHPIELGFTGLASVRNCHHHLTQLRPTLANLSAYADPLPYHRQHAPPHHVDLALHFDPALSRRTRWLQFPRLTRIGPSELPWPTEAGGVQAPRRPSQIFPLQLPAVPDIL